MPDGAASDDADVAVFGQRPDVIQLILSKRAVIVENASLPRGAGLWLQVCGDDGDDGMADLLVAAERQPLSGRSVRAGVGFVGHLQAHRGLGLVE